MSRFPVAFIPHGGGPWPFVDFGLPREKMRELQRYLRALASLPPTPPKALLVVSAHWEAPVPTVMTSPRPPILYDCYNFPPASYELTWPAPGEPGLAARVRRLLADAGFETDSDPDRGFDHGTFIPLKVAYPDATIPTIQLSLVDDLDPAKHLATRRRKAARRPQQRKATAGHRPVGQYLHQRTLLHERNGVKGRDRRDAETRRGDRVRGPL